MIVDVKGIPVRRRDGVIVYALVDPEDFAPLNDFVWTLQNGLSGYVRRGGKRSREKANVYMHREIMGLPPFAEDPRVVDHINRDKLDNRRANLRVVTQAQNSQNHPGHPGGTSKHRGVHFDRRRQKWVARAVVARRAHVLGEFATEDEAAAAAVAFRVEHMPFAVEEAIA